MILTVDPENTVLVDGESGLPLNVSDVEKGVLWLIRAGHDPVFAASVYAGGVFANVSEDGEAAPYYAVIAARPVVGDNSYLTVNADDGATYVIPDNADVKPFRTRNVVKCEDIHAGTRCLFWLDEQEEAFRVVVLDAE